MFKYVVISNQLSDSDIQSVSTDWTKIIENVWVVRTEHDTSIKLCQALSLDETLKKHGVVFKYSEYYGWFVGSLWEKLDSW